MPVRSKIRRKRRNVSLKKKRRTYKQIGGEAEPSLRRRAARLLKGLGKYLARFVTRRNRNNQNQAITNQNRPHPPETTDNPGFQESIIRQSPIELDVEGQKTVARAIPKYNKFRVVCLIKFSDNPEIDFEYLVLKYGLNEKYNNQIYIESQNYKQLHNDLQDTSLKEQVLGYYGSGIAEGEGNRIPYGEAASTHRSYKFTAELENGTPAEFSLFFKFGEILDMHYYLLLEYNPNYKTLYEIDSIYKSQLNQIADPIKLRTEIYKAVWESISALNEKCGFVHGDLKNDNVMIDMNELLKSTKNNPIIKVKNFDFDLSSFVQEYLPEQGLDANQNPAKTRLKQLDGLTTKGPSTDFSEQVFDLKWPLFLKDDRVVRIEKGQRRLVFLNANEPELKLMLLIFDLWRFYLGYNYPFNNYTDDKLLFSKQFDTTCKITREFDEQSYTLSMEKMQQKLRQDYEAQKAKIKINAAAAFESNYNKMFNGEWMEYKCINAFKNDFKQN